MKRSLLPVAALAALTLPVSACDDVEDQPVTVVALPLVEPEIAEDGVVSFRGDPGEPEGLYITKWGGNAIHRTQFVKAILACGVQSDPPLTCTLSWYQPDSSKPERVLGLGCSMMADFNLWQCYQSAWIANGGMPL